MVTAEPMTPTEPRRMNSPTSLIDTLIEQPTFQEFRRAFSETTGMPVALRHPESVTPPHRGQLGENAFCALLAGGKESCAGCQRLQQRLTEDSRKGTTILTCPFGLREAAVPVRLGHDRIGVLQTGQAFRYPPTDADYKLVARQVLQSGVVVDPEKLRSAYFRTPVLSDRELQSAVRLLEIFAEFLVLRANQFVLQTTTPEPQILHRAKQFISDHLHEPLPLTRVAAAAHISPFYLCKLFRKCGSMSFKEFVSRLRIERAKMLLLNPQKRISEACFEAGFNSLTSFNRVFHHLVGLTPSEYRSSLMHHTAPPLSDKIEPSAITEADCPHAPQLHQCPH